jgi:hypothetical protein
MTDSLRRVHNPEWNRFTRCLLKNDDWQNPVFQKLPGNWPLQAHYRQSHIHEIVLIFTCIMIGCQMLAKSNTRLSEKPARV